MKRRYFDGRHVLRFTPRELLLRLCALVPPPRFHMIRYAGLFSAHARGRYALTGRGMHDRPRGLTRRQAATQARACAESPTPTATCAPPAANVHGRPAGYFIAKLDALTGQAIWVRPYSGNALATGIEIDQAGDVVVAGFITSSVDLGGGTVPVTGGGAAFVAKYRSADGRYAWSRTFDGDLLDRVDGVALDAGTCRVTRPPRTSISAGARSPAPGKCCSWLATAAPTVGTSGRRCSTRSTAWVDVWRHDDRSVERGDGGRARPHLPRATMPRKLTAPSDRSPCPRQRSPGARAHR